MASFGGRTRHCGPAEFLSVLVVLLCVIGSLVGVATNATAEGGTGGLDELHRILEDGEYQTSYPTQVEREPADYRRPKLAPQTGAVPQAFLIGVGLLLLFFLATQIVREVQDRRMLAAGNTATTTGPSAVQLAIPWDGIDELVRDGRFAAAVRELLRRTFGSLASHQRLVLRDAFTSREVVRRLQLSDDGRGALTDLATTVEHSLFGGEDVDEADYRRCLGAYHTLVDTLKSGSASEEARP